jgi:hypothetical protein
VVTIILLGIMPASAQWTIQGGDESSWIKLGFLVQGRAETVEILSSDESSDNLYLRRLRLLAGGSLTERISFFMETDSPNLGKSNPDGSKVSGDMYIQDFVITYSAGDGFKLDGGLLLPPMSYNSTQSAASLLAADYGAYSFLASAPTTSRVGRDYGVQARGYLLEKRLEYRAIMLQGARDDDSTAPFRYGGRLMLHFLEPQTGLFYSGTSLGTKKLFSIGASIDSQDSYQTVAGDIYLDLPVNGGDGITFQVDYMHYDGDEFFTQLPEQETYLLEAAYYIKALKISPFIQLLERDFKEEWHADQERYSAGIAWWPHGHRGNLKLQATRISQDGIEDRLMWMLQAQIFMF